MDEQIVWKPIKRDWAVTTILLEEEFERLVEAVANRVVEKMKSTDPVGSQS